ncbi:DNA transfer protein [Escherichia coli]|nr:DNA transfer protein [Escherichia coli]ELS5789633.1 DNA transfer protein [Escherichia coli]
MLIFQIANKHLSKVVYCKGGSDGGSKAQARATEKGIELQREMWQTNMQNLAPFTPLAQQYVSELQNLSSLQGQGQALNQYYNSQQYKDLAGQARYQSLAAAEATGGLGSTATGNQLAAIAPTLGQNWLSGQMNNYNNLANIGLGSLTGQANAGQNYANNVSQLYQQQAAASAANANRPSGLQSALGGAMSGAASGAMIGSVVPGIGTAVGAIGGGIIGGLGSLF